MMIKNKIMRYLSLLLIFAILIPTWAQEEETLPEGEIIFISNRDGDSEIYIMNADGSNQRNLTNHLARDEFPRWSPDGKWIAFVSDRDNRNDDCVPRKFCSTNVFIMNADGGDLRRLSEQDGWNINPVWSPDSSHIAYLHDDSGNFSYLHLHIVNLDGTNDRELAPELTMASEDLNGGSDPMDWSPSGNLLALSAVCLECKDADNHVDIFLVDLITGEFDFVQSNGSSPVFSPDGDYLLFLRYYWEWSFGFSPVEDCNGTNLECLIHTTLPDLGEETGFLPVRDFLIRFEDGWFPTDIFMRIGDGRYSGFAASPDGYWYADTRLRDADTLYPQEIYISRFDDTNAYFLTENDFSDYFPQWRPQTEEN